MGYSTDWYSQTAQFSTLTVVQNGQTLTLVTFHSLVAGDMHTRAVYNTDRGVVSTVRVFKGPWIPKFHLLALCSLWITVATVRSCHSDPSYHWHGLLLFLSSSEDGAALKVWFCQNNTIKEQSTRSGTKSHAFGHLRLCSHYTPYSSIPIFPLFQN